MFLHLRTGPLHQKAKKRAKERDDVISMWIKCRSLPLHLQPHILNSSQGFITQKCEKTSLNNHNNVAVTYCQHAPHLCTANSEPGKQQQQEQANIMPALLGSSLSLINSLITFSHCFRVYLLSARVQQRQLHVKESFTNVG